MVMNAPNPPDRPVTLWSLLGFKERVLITLVILVFLFKGVPTIWHAIQTAL